MTTDLTPPDPARFSLTSFADLPPSRAPIIGEDPGSFEGFHAGMMQSLLPVTPYESVHAAKLGPPLIKTGTAHPVHPTQFRDRRAALRLLQDAHNLCVTKSCCFHQKSPQISWRKNFAIEHH